MSTQIEAKGSDVKKTMNDAVTAGANQGAKLLQDGATQARATMDKTVAQSTKATEGLLKAAGDAAEFSRGNVEAFAQATQAYMAGVQDLGRMTLAMVQGLTEQAIEASRALSGVKSLKDATDIQTNLARSAMERSLAETTKLQETALRVAEQSFAPLSARMSLAVETMARPIAA
jgi:phasin family protein